MLLGLLERGIPVVATDLQPNMPWVRQLAQYRDRESGGQDLQDALENAEILRLDVSDETAVRGVFEAHPDLTHVIHLAYLFNTDILADQRRAAAVNIMGSIYLQEAAAESDIRRMVFASSETVYGPSQSAYGDHPVHEEEDCAPHDHHYLYGMMKLLNERTAAEYVKERSQFGKPLAAFQNTQFKLAEMLAVLWAGAFASNPAVGKPVGLPFAGQSRESWIYVDDCAEQFIRLALKPEALSHLSYNSGGFSHTAEEIMRMVADWIPDAAYDFNESVPRTPLVDDTDGTRLEQEIDFTLRPMKEALHRHINEARFRAGQPPI